MSSRNNRKANLDFMQKWLKGEDFSGQDLRGANFRGAHLKGADFSGAKIEGANFDGANLKGTILEGKFPNARQASSNSPTTNLKDQLIKLGHTNPELRPHLSKVIDRIVECQRITTGNLSLPSSWNTEPIFKSEGGVFGDNETLKGRNAKQWKIILSNLWYSSEDYENCLDSLKRAVSNAYANHTTKWSVDNPIRVVGEAYMRAVSYSNSVREAAKAFHTATSLNDRELLQKLDFLSQNWKGIQGDFSTISNIYTRASHQDQQLVHFIKKYNNILFALEEHEDLMR